MESLKRVEKRKTRKGADLKVQTLELVTSAAETAEKDSEIVLHKSCDRGTIFFENESSREHKDYVYN